MVESDAEFVERLTENFFTNLEKGDVRRLSALARRGAEAGELMAEQDREYNRKTNALIARHAERTSAAAARIEQLEKALRGLVGAVADHTSQKSIPDALKEARAALEGKP